MLRVSEAQLVSYFTDAFRCTKQAFFCHFQRLQLNMFQGRKPRFFPQQIAQIVWRKTELIGTILYGRQTIGSQFIGIKYSQQTR